MSQIYVQPKSVEWPAQINIILYLTHTHTFLTALCPGLPGWAGTRKVKPIWILLKQETASSSGISWAICTSASRSRQITTPAPHHSVFTGWMPFLPPNQQCQSTEGLPQYLHTHTHNRLMAFCLGLPGYAGTRRNIHPLTPILIIGHPLSSSSIDNDPWHPFCSVYELDSPLGQPLSRSSLVFLLDLGPFSSLFAEVPPHFLSLQARSHFHAACCFAHNYCTTFLS